MLEAEKRSYCSITALSKEMDIRKSTICDTKRSEDNLTSFATKMEVPRDI